MSSALSSVTSAGMGVFGSLPYLLLLLPRISTISYCVHSFVAKLDTLLAFLLQQFQQVIPCTVSARKLLCKDSGWQILDPEKEEYASRSSLSAQFCATSLRVAGVDM